MFQNNNTLCLGWHSNSSKEKEKSEDGTIRSAMAEETSPSPSLQRRRLSNTYKYKFTSLSPTILSSVVIGIEESPVYYITTSGTALGHTTFRDTLGSVIAFVDWKKPPIVEIKGRLSRMLIRDWLQVSLDSESGR